MGLSQVFALLPGISRAGITICSALLLGYDQKTAAKFSFLWQSRNAWCIGF